MPNVRLHLAALLPALKQSIRQAPSSHTMRLHHDYKQFAVNLSNHCSECCCASCGEHNKTVDYTCIPVVDVDGTQTEPRWHMSFSPTPDCTNEHVCVCALPGQDCATNGQIAFHILVHLCSGHNSSSTTAASLAAASTPSSSPATLIDGCIQSHNDRHLHLVEHINTPC